MQDMNLSKQHREDLIALCESLKTKSPEDAVSINNIIQFIRDQKYGLLFERHQEQVDVDLITKIPVFIEDTSKRIDLGDDSKYNFLLEGDNLHSLKLLEKTHKGTIDVIYIDPPYNTGNEFTYNDKIVGKEDGYRHSKWLSFMSERLEIAERLLSKNGIILISIDEYEQANLKLLCDNIFGQENLITNFVWQKKKGGGQAKYVYEGHEYILAYAKDKTMVGKLLVNDDAKLSGKKYMQKDGKTYFINDDFIRTVFGKYEKGTERRCHYEDILEVKGQDKFDEVNERLLSGEYILRESDSVKGKHYVCRLEDVSMGKKKIVYSIFSGIRTEDGNTDATNLGITFDNPKPVELIKILLNLTQNKNAIILDFFAGSGTTGHATLELNEIDGGNRRFILCTNNENKICEKVTYQRLKTVITGIRADNSKYSDGIFANLKYFKAEMIERNDDDLDEKLLDASIPLIELENFEDIEDDNSSVFIAYSDEDLDEFEENFDKENNLVKTIYAAEDVCLSETQEQLFAFNDIKVKTIPNNFFKEL